MEYFTIVIDFLFPDPSIAIAFMGGGEMFLVALDERKVEKKVLLFMFGYALCSIGVLTFFIFRLKLEINNIGIYVFYFSLIAFFLSIFIVGILAKKYMMIDKPSCYINSWSVRILLRSLNLFCLLSALFLILLK